MTRAMFDAVTLENIPKTGSTLIAAYLDGKWPNYTAAKAMFPHEKIVPIAVFASTAPQRGYVLDRETGDATIAEAVAWCRAYPGSNEDLTIYTDESDWPALRAALLVLSTKPNIWLAAYDNNPIIPTDPVFNIIGKQYATGNFDKSVVKDYWPGVDAAPSTGGVVVTGPQMFRGVKLDQSSITKLTLAEEWLDTEYPGITLSFPQGSYSSGVSASAGTHDGGGAVDVHCNTYTTAVKNRLVHWLRAVGFAAWHRPLNWDGAGGSEHVHCEEIGNPNLSSGARSQITQWNDHQNGLANHGADNEPIDVAAGRPAKITTGPKAEPAPTKFTPGEEPETMLALIHGTTGGAYYVLYTSGKTHHITSTPDLAQWRKFKLPEIQFSNTELAAIVTGS